MNDGLTIPQSAVLAYRIVGNRAEILLVTSRTRGRWVVPKGMIAPGMTPAESAVKEAWEEAGIAGSVSRGCLGVYRYMKTRRCGVRSCAVKVYAMKVTAVLPKWPEQRMRRRRWMSIDEAICRVMDRDLKRLLITFRARLRSHGLAFADAGARIGGDHRGMPHHGMPHHGMPHHGMPRGDLSLNGNRAGVGARRRDYRTLARPMRWPMR